MLVDRRPDPPTSATLSAVERRTDRPLERRARDLRSLTDEPWDLVVVGGGVTGAGILLDAASRGLRAALVERDDLAVGTSSRSSRLIHGGLRYLERFQVGLVREALAERSRLLRLAPHLVTIEPFLFPLYGPPLVTRFFYGTGIALYDMLGAARDGGRARHLGVEATLRLAPVLRRGGLRGGIVYHDGAEDDARFVVALVRTARTLGAVAATRTEATGVVRDGSGRTTGIVVRDRLDGSEITIRASHVVDATGVWASRPENPFGGPPVPMVPSRGSHLVVARDRLPLHTGMTIRVPGKVVFLVPWPDAWVIGTTDEPDPGPPDRPAPTEHEVRRILATVNGTLDVDLRLDEVLGAFTGIRPLVGDGADGSTIKVSREHRVRVGADGLVRIGGGKYTTYRVMACDAVDAALGEEARRRPSATADLPLVGAADRPALDGLARSLATDHGLAPGVAERLVARHGTEATTIAAMATASGLSGTLGPGVSQLEAEVAWAADEEMALSLDDVLSRRMRLSTTLADRGASLAPRVAGILGARLGWDEARQREEIDRYLASAHREYDVPGRDAGSGSSGTAGDAVMSSPGPAPVVAGARAAR